MAKDIFNATVSAKAKDGFRNAGLALHGTERGMTRVFNEVGESLEDSLAGLRREHGGAVPAGLSIQCRLVRSAAPDTVKTEAAAQVANGPLAVEV